MFATAWHNGGANCAAAPAITPIAVAAYITSAYWFTAPTSFANPAVTLARAASNTFAGIRPSDARRVSSSRNWRAWLRRPQYSAGATQLGVTGPLPPVSQRLGGLQPLSTIERGVARFSSLLLKSAQSALRPLPAGCHPAQTEQARCLPTVN